MEMSRDAILRLLQELDQWMELEDCPPVDWVVCGGAALGLQELQDRPTRDVDVLGRWDEAVLDVVGIETFPEEMVACINRVVANHPELAGMGQNWINLGPRALVQAGLPKGFADRLHVLRVGNKLTLHLLGRWDLLALKLYAAADEHGPRQEIHFADLKGLTPTYDELDQAVEWLRTLRNFEEKRPVVKHVIERLGYEDLAYYV
ncbi:MAG: hypothetical protein GXO73_07830 [Calditrichaeota bacterium]|nr:hypothetical protein [Calditrichota bacterium]